MDVITTAKLTTPAADLAELSFCQTNAPALADWVAGLPMANTQNTADQLLLGTGEVSRLKISSVDRMQLLEQLRPTLEYICSRLDRSSSSSENSEEQSILAQRLQTNLTVGYKSVIRDADPSTVDDRRVVTLATHRTIADLSRTLLRSCQHYVAPSRNLWLELNQLYSLAERMGVATHNITDDENHSVMNMSISDHYMRCLLLASSKPNQLRERQLTAIFNALEQWVGYTSIVPTADDSLFCIDLDKDLPPRYTRLVEDKSGSGLRGLNTGKLVYQLEAYLKGIDTELPIPDFVEEQVANHLASCWGEIAKRGFRRAPATGNMKVAVGMRAVHYFISGGVDFVDQLGSADALLRKEINPFLDGYKSKQTHNSGWSTDEGTHPNSGTTGAIDPGADLSDFSNKRTKEAVRMAAERERDEAKPEFFDRSSKASADESADSPTIDLISQDPTDVTKDKEVAELLYPFHEIKLEDSSPGGYRISWGEDAPPNMQAGDVMAVREERDQRWCIAVLRWVRKVEGVTQTGLELMAPRAIPVAVRIVQKKGGPTDYTRALLLPELSAIQQPASLITPAIMFTEQQKIHLQRQGIQATAQLAEERLRTESFIQFTFRMLDGYLENSQIDLNISSAWDASEDITMTANR